MNLLNDDGQGATEYLLMLAAVLVIVASAVYYVTTRGAGGPTVIFTAENQGSDVIMTVEEGTSPTPMRKSWDWAVFSGGSNVSGWNTNSTDLGLGDTVTLPYNAATGDTLKVRVGGTVNESTIKAP